MSLEYRGRFRRLAGNRDLVALLGAALVSQTGDWILATGIAFQVFAVTGSTIASAAVLFATLAPQVLVGSVAGVFVDRWDRRRVMLIVNLLLAVTLVPLALVRGADGLGVVFAVVAVSSCLTPFFLAAEASLLPAVVADPELLVTANAANGQVRNVARLFGAALGGVLVASGGFTAIAVADIASFLLAAALLVAVRARRTVAPPARVSAVTEWMDGVRVILRSRPLTVVLLFFVVSGVGEAIMTGLFAPFVRRELGGTGVAYGGILAAQAVGGIAGGMAVTAFGHRFPPRLLFGGGAVVFGAVDLALFLSPLLVRSTLPAFVLITLVGLPAAALSAGMMTIFQTATTETDRGRVFGAVTTAQNAAALASTLVAGGAAASVGIIPVIALQGVAYVVSGIGILVLLPRRAGETPIASAP